MKAATVRFGDLWEAFEFVNSAQKFENAAYLCRATGKIYWHSELVGNVEPLPEDIEDPGKYIPIAHRNDLGLGKRLVLRFASEFLPEDFEEIEAIFSRPGAYARFKDLLDRRGKLEQWYEYEQQEHEKALRDWCRVNGIEVEG